MQQLAANATFAEALHRANTAIAPLNTGGDRIPVFWIHSVTGQGTDPVQLARQLGERQPFYSIRAPSGRRDAEFADAIDGMAAFYADAIVRCQPSGPMIVGGWSAGVVVALEVAQQLRAAGREVRHLVAVDFAPLNSPVRINPLLDLARRTNNWLRKESRLAPSGAALARRFGRKLLEGAGLVAPAAHPLDDLIAQLGCSAAEAGFIRTLHDRVDAYVPAPYGGSVLFYYGDEAGGAVGAAAEGRDQRWIGRGLSFASRLTVSRNARHMVKVWTALADRLTVSRIDGDHSSLMKGPAVAALAAHLEADLLRARSDGG